MADEPVKRCQSPVSPVTRLMPTRFSQLRIAAGRLRFTPSAVGFRARCPRRPINPKPSQRLRLRDYNLNLQQQLGAGTRDGDSAISALRTSTCRIELQHQPAHVSGQACYRTAGVKPYRFDGLDGSLIRSGAPRLGQHSAISTLTASSPITTPSGSSVRKTLSTRHLQMNSTYTWSKSHGHQLPRLAGHGYTLQDSYQSQGRTMACSDFDTRNHFRLLRHLEPAVSTAIALKEGWLLANITQLQTGNPLNVVTSNTTYNGVIRVPFGLQR